MENKLHEYLKHYIGCECQNINNGVLILIKPRNFSEIRERIIKGLYKPILRRISSLTDDEKIEMFDIEIPDLDGSLVTYFGKLHFVYKWIYQNTFSPKAFHYLTSLGIWIFGDEYFDNGWIIDENTLKP